MAKPTAFQRGGRWIELWAASWIAFLAPPSVLPDSPPQWGDWLLRHHRHPQRLKFAKAMRHPISPCGGDVRQDEGATASTLTVLPPPHPRPRRSRRRRGRAIRPRRGMVVDAHLEDEIGRRAEADTFHLRDPGRVRRQRLAHIVLAAEMVGRAGRPVAAIDRAAEALVEIVGGHAIVEFLAADQPADLVGHRLARLEVREIAVLVVAGAVGEPARHADLRRPAIVVDAVDRRREGGELAGDLHAVVERLAFIRGDLAGQARMAREHRLAVRRQQALRELHARSGRAGDRRADRALPAAQLPAKSAASSAATHGMAAPAGS